MTFQSIDATPEQISLAERVADLAESGQVRQALELLADEGDPAARADANLALAHDTRNRANVARALALMVAAAALVLPATASAAQSGSPATLGAPVTHVALAKPASKALLARAEKFVTLNIHALHSPSTWRLSCAGSTKRIVCTGRSTQNVDGTPVPNVTEIVLVKHGKMSSKLGPVVGVAKASAASVRRITVSQQQAVIDAKNYLQYEGGFSLSGLIGQLEYDGFTASQAKYGAKSVGL